MNRILKLLLAFFITGLSSLTLLSSCSSKPKNDIGIVTQEQIDLEILNEIIDKQFVQLLSSKLKELPQRYEVTSVSNDQFQRFLDYGSSWEENSNNT